MQSVTAASEARVSLREDGGMARGEGGQGGLQLAHRATGLLVGQNSGRMNEHTQGGVGTLSCCFSECVCVCVWF